MKILVKNSFVFVETMAPYQMGKEYEVSESEGKIFITEGHAILVETKEETIKEEKPKKRKKVKED